MSKPAPGGDKTQHYNAIVACIRQTGKVNPNYKTDKDLTYGELKNKIGHKVPGLVALLKTLKRDKRVDYNDEGVMMKDTCIITAIGNADDEKLTEFIKYEDIIAKLGAEEGTHTKVGSWGGFSQQ